MKKTITQNPTRSIFRWLVCAVFLLGLTATNMNAQNLLTESFDGATFAPTGWTNLLTSGTNTWTRVTAGTSPTQATHSGAAEAKFNCFSSPGTGVRSLVTPVLNFTPSGTKQVSFWMYRDNGYNTTADKMDVLVNTSASLTGATLLGTVNRAIGLAPTVGANGWYQYTYTVTGFSTATNYVFFRATGAYGNNIYIDDISVDILNPCTGTPAPGNTLSSANPACSGVNFTLSLQTATTGTGVTYQWQSSADGTTWANVASATSSTLVTNTTSAKYYHCLVTCSGSTGTSNSLLQNVAGCINMTNGSTTTCSANFYSSAGNGAQYASNENYTYTFYPNAGNLIRAAFSAFSTETGWDGLVIYNGPTTGSPIISSGLGVGSSATNCPAGSFYGTTSPGTVTSSDASGALTFQFRSDGSGTSTGWAAVISCIANPACSGTPAPGNTLSTLNPVCPSTSFTLSYANIVVATGQSYQWQSSPDGSTWSNVAGATSNTLVTTQSVNTYYQCLVTCSGSTGTSTPLLITTNSWFNCYCTNTNTTYTSYYTSAFSTTGGISNITNNASGFSTNGYGNFTAMSVSQYTGSSVNFSSTIVGTSSGFAIWIDWNQNGSFADAGEQVYNSASYVYGATGSFTVPGGATPGATRMRIVSNGTSSTPAACVGSGFSECEDYTFTVLQLLPCAGTPAPGNTLSNVTAVCSGGTANLSLQNATTGTGVTYQWYANGSLIGGATSATYTTPGITLATTYYCAVTCSGNTGNSNSVTINMNSAAACIAYCIPTTVYGCSDGDVIARVQLNTLDNNSGTGCPSAMSGYSDYRNNGALTTTLNAGTSYNCTVWAGQWTEGYAAWIDYNDDGVFNNTTERIGYSNGQVAGSGGVGVLGASAVFPISLACNPPVGTHTLRVRAMYNLNGSAVTPCTGNSYGEVEDYLITVAPPPPCPMPSALAASNFGTTSADLTWTVGCTETSWDVEFGTVGHTAGTGTIVSAGTNPYTLTGLPCGATSDVYIRANCGGGNGTSGWYGPISVTTTICPCNGAPAPGSTLASVTTTCIGGSATLSLQNATSGAGVTYQWYNGAGSIAGATSATYTASGLTLTDNFYCNVTCTASAITTASTSVTVNVVASPAGDSQADPIVVASLPYTTSVNTASCFTNAFTGTYNQSAPDVFYRIVPCGNSISVSLCGSGFDTYVHIADAAGTEVAHNDDNGPACSGTESSIGNFTVTPNATYYIIVEGYGSNTGTIQVNITQFDTEVPTITAPSAVAVCNGDAITLGTPTTGDNCGVATVSNNAPGVFPVGLTVVTWTVTDVNSNVATATQNVTVNALPDATIVSTNAFHIDCNVPQEVLYPTNSSYGCVWTVGGTFWGTFASGIAAPLSGTWGLTVTDGNGCTASSTAVITENFVAPDATISATNGLTFCDGNNTTLSVPVTGTTSQVWNQNGVFFATSSNPLVTVAATYDVTVTDAANGCTASSSATTIVNPLPIGSASSIVICNGDPSNVPLNSTEAGTTYTWTSAVTLGAVIGNNDCNGGCGASIADVLTNTGNVHGVVEYTVTPTSGLGCTGTPFTVDVTVGAAPAAPVISGPNALCGLTSTFYTVAAVPEATSYVWTVPTGVTGMTITGGQGTTSLHVSISAGTVSGDVTCTAINNCGNSVTTTYAVTKKPAVPGAITGPTSTCAQSTATYSVAPVFGATSYIWTLPPGMTASGASNLNSITVNIAGTFIYGQLKVSAGNACGNIPGTGIWITGNAPTTPLTLSGPANVCGLTSGTYSIPAVAGASGYNWLITGAGNSISGSNTGTTVTAILAGPGTISVAATNLCGTGPYRVLNLVTTALQPGVISGPLNTCGLTTASYSVAAVANAATYNWSLAYGMTWVNGQGTNVINVNIAPGLTANTATSPLKLTETNTCGNTSLFRTTTITRCLSPDALNTDGVNTFSAIYPNPTSAEFTMDVTVDKDQEIVLEVFDILGNVVISEKHNLAGGTSIMKTNMEQFNNGMYFVRILDANSNVMHTERVVKQ